MNELIERTARAQVNVIETLRGCARYCVALVGHFQFQSHQPETLLDFGRDDIPGGSARPRMQPVQTGFIDLQIRVIHQKRFGKSALAIFAAAVQPVEQPVPCVFR